MTKHLAVDSRTGEKLIVSYMLIPEGGEKALVTRTDRVPQQIQRALLALVAGPEAQSCMDLAEVLGRRVFADSGKTMFQILHETKNLEAIPIDQVNMTPRSNMAYPLRAILQQMGRVRNQQVDSQMAEQGYNPHTNNQAADVNDEKVAIARNLLVEAEMLDADANRKRDAAYQMAPSLRPVMPVGPTPTAPTPLTETAPAEETPPLSEEELAQNIKEAWKSVLEGEDDNLGDTNEGDNESTD